MVAGAPPRRSGRPAGAWPQGLYLAVTTFVLALATTSFLLNDDYFGWVPTERIQRAPLLGGLQVEPESAVYYPALAVLVVVMAGLRGVRTSRFGRALVAPRATTRRRRRRSACSTSACAWGRSLSGAIAALAGGLFVHHERPILVLLADREPGRAGLSLWSVA